MEITEQKFRDLDGGLCKPWDEESVARECGRISMTEKSTLVGHSMEDRRAGAGLGGQLGSTWGHPRGTEAAVPRTVGSDQTQT